MTNFAIWWCDRKYEKKSIFKILEICIKTLNAFLTWSGESSSSAHNLNRHIPRITTSISSEAPKIMEGQTDILSYKATAFLKNLKLKKISTQRAINPKKNLCAESKRLFLKSLLLLIPFYWMWGIYSERGKPYCLLL